MKHYDLLSAGYSFQLNGTSITIEVNLVDGKEYNIPESTPFQITLPEDPDFAKEEGIDVEILINGTSPLIEKIYGNLDLDGQESFCESVSAFACSCLRKVLPRDFKNLKDCEDEIRSLNQEITKAFSGLEETLKKSKQTKNDKSMQLSKLDLKKIGHTAYGDTGHEFPHDDTEYLNIICDIDIAHIEGVRLRNILSLFGDYEIIETKGWTWVKEKEGLPNDIQFVTNLPWKEFQKL